MNLEKTEPTGRGQNKQLKQSDPGCDGVGRPSNILGLDNRTPSVDPAQVRDRGQRASCPRLSSKLNFWDGKYTEIAQGHGEVLGPVKSALSPINFHVRTSGQINILKFQSGIGHEGDYKMVCRDRHSPS